MKRFLSGWCAALAACALAVGGCGSDENGGEGGSAGCEKCPSGGSGGAGAGGSGGSTGGSPSGGGSAGAGGSAGSAGGSAGASGDCLAQAQGIAVADVDLDGFPSYTVDACKLLYVAASSKELKLKDLSSGNEETIAPASENPRRPTLAGPVMAWEADAGGKSVVRMRTGGVTKTLDPPAFDHAGEPRATADAVVFTGWKTALPDGDTDVFVYELSSQSVKPVATGTGQQRFADVSPTHVAVSDFSEDATGIYSGDGTSQANVILYDRATLTATVRNVVGKQAFPMLGSSGSLSYLEWLTVHPVPKLQEYTIQAVPLTTPTATSKQIASVQSQQAVRPTARAGVVEWVVRWNDVSSLWRAPLDGSAAPTQISLGTATVLHAPSASTNMTVLAVRQTAADMPALLAIPK